MPDLSVVIVSYNTRAILGRCLSSLDEAAAGATLAIETIVVDNASTDGTSAAVRQAYPMIHLLHQEFNGGPVSKNLAIRSARGRCRSHAHDRDDRRR